MTMAWKKEQITQQLHPINDWRMRDLKTQWFERSQKEVSYKEFVPLANEWFQSTRCNTLIGWNEFPCVDVTMGNTHYIESFVLKHGWQGFQILRNEYAYYTLMGKHGVDAQDLEEGKPLLITMPHWQFCDLRPEWADVLRICEQRKIDIHIDMAWIIMAKDIDLDLSHPCIKSFGMSLSKYSLQWSRVGLRWSRQKSMDSITIFNDYYHETNTMQTSIGAYWMENLDRDHCWNVHGANHHDICRALDLTATKIIHVARDPQTGQQLGIGNMLGQATPDCV